ncbi:unnamed protein product [Urochloa decumbens]|uniref:DUF295 domain-containing protein n=1 Tax=Urochloa decumbens TaxID=240449 RepID=A0ABC9FKR5_9POAL
MGAKSKRAHKTLFRSQLPPTNLRRRNSHHAAGAGANGGARGGDPPPLPAARARAPHPRRPRLQAMGPPHLRPRVPPQVPRAPPRAAHAGAPLQRHRRPDGGSSSCCFVPTAAFRPTPPQTEQRGWRALDSRHGRVLLRRPRGERFEMGGLVVWDPNTEEKRELPSTPRHTSSNSNAAVLCSAGACNHLIATGDPSSWFLCARTLGRRSFAPTHPMLLRGATQYISTQCPGDDCILSNIDPGKLVGNALYFLFLNKAAALKYDLDLQEASMVGLPPEYTCWRPAVLTATEGGGLGFANVHEHKLYMWLMKPGPGVDAAGWVQSRVIDLEMLVCNDAILTSAALVGSADGVGVVFMHASDVIYALDLKTNKVKKACEGRRIYAVIPYTSFYTPALGAVCTGEEPSAGGSSA